MGEVLAFPLKPTFRRLLRIPETDLAWDAREVLTDFQGLEPGRYTVSYLRRKHGLCELAVPKGHSRLPLELEYVETEA